MIILSKGFQLPETYDSGAEFFPALEHNITQVNGHTHDGTDSQRLTAAAGTVITQAISAAGWSLVGVGNYSQVITLPAPLLFDEISIQTRLSTGDIVYLSVNKSSANTYTVFINDPTLALKAVYSS